MNISNPPVRLTLFSILIALAIITQPSRGLCGQHRRHVPPPIVVTGQIYAKASDQEPLGDLDQMPGVETSVVFHADREHPEQSDSLGWTYHHHPDMGFWRGRFYVGWDSCKRDEDTWPSHELYSTSEDGRHWAAPSELFPMGVSTALRMYFYRASNGHMLAIAGLRTSYEKVREETKGGLVVREVLPDHTLGPVYVLRKAPEVQEIPENAEIPFYTESIDEEFVDACQDLLANRLYLEQQDYGKLLDPSERFSWEVSSRSHRNLAGLSRAMCFYERADGAFVGIAKEGWVTVSTDKGRTWRRPVRPETLITGMGKVWAQSTASGQYILIYNPNKDLRDPLAIVTGNDGITFGHMQSVTAPLPQQRYPGLGKDIGASYVRGLSGWNSDATLSDKRVWIVYSVNKEDIWVSRLPL